MADRIQEQIARKYGPAFEQMGRQQVRMTEMVMHGDKLYVLAWAPSPDAKNRVWDQIKVIDPAYADLICDIRVEQEEPATAGVHQEFNQVVQSAPQGALAKGLADAFRSDRTPSFGQMLSRLFEHSDSRQRAGLLNSLFALTPSSVASEVLGVFGGRKQLSPEEAQRVSPEAVRRIADQAQKTNPSVVDRASEFYADYPGLVKTLGIGALTIAMSKLVGGLRGRSGGAG